MNNNEEVTQIILLVNKLKSISDKEFESMDEFHQGPDSGVFGGDAIFWMAVLEDEAEVVELWRRNELWHIWDQGEEESEEPKDGLTDYDFNEKIYELAREGFLAPRGHMGEHFYDEIAYNSADLTREEMIEALRATLDSYLGPRTRVLLEAVVTQVRSEHAWSEPVAVTSTTMVQAPSEPTRPPRRERSFNLLDDLGDDTGEDVES